jgi:hypothetical protein
LQAIGSHGCARPRATDYSGAGFAFSAEPFL